MQITRADADAEAAAGSEPRWSSLSGRLVLALGGSALLLVALLVLWALGDGAHDRRVQQAQLRMARLGPALAGLDEQLGRAAYLAATTADPLWEQRHRELEHALDGALHEAHAVIGELPGASELARVQAGSERLRSLEHQAFEHGRAQRRGEALALLEGAQYAQLRRAQQERLGDALAALPQHALAYGGQRLWRVTSFACLVAGLLALLARVGLWQRQQASREIIERLQSERLMRRSELRYRALLDASVDPLLTIDARGAILGASRNVEPVLGWTAGGLIGQSVAVLMPEPHRSRLGDYLREHLRTGQSTLLGQVRVASAVRKDGSVFPCELRIVRVDIPGEPEPIFSGTIHDITRRHQLEIQLRQAQRLESVGQLAAGIAHEINTPMQFIGDNVNFLRDALEKLVEVLNEHRTLTETTDGAPSHALHLDRARETWDRVDVEFLLAEIPGAITQSLEGIARVSSIVHAMKEFSHPGSREKTSVDLHRALQSTIEVSRNEWKHVARIETQLDPELPPVRCHPSEINQVFLNLLVNAAHAIREANQGKDTLGTITIRTCGHGDWVEVRMSDTGTGIPEAIRDRVFDPFFTTKDVGEGTGQGLAIARSVVVDKHGGTIELETELGKGTTFILRLPA